MTCPDCNQPLELALMCSGPLGCGGMKAEEEVKWDISTYFHDNYRFTAKVESRNSPIEVGLFQARHPDGGKTLGRHTIYVALDVLDENGYAAGIEAISLGYFESKTEAKAAGELLVRVLRAIFGEAK
jgi:hypothetical protein